ncbi:L,D-transpeptidase family protein [Paracoccus xiamenensis]|uniref:L,D-transpeptidase family protein n=1 Tax=Paracoccus xiamenensis TaxID=2714901 RepID=UPI00140869BE|nr:L,D-transpeptidase family protein [Paracoccus xiamenensis]NHF71850.1 L,D-transpeptidase family protein [Paracoccus xiamenensis]
MRRRLIGVVLLLAAIPVAAAAYTRAMRAAHGIPPAMATATAQADRIVVDKPARLMQLMRGDEVIGSYAISLGAAPEGHKTREGDEKTPEGSYVIDWRNDRSAAHLSLHISYPNAADSAAADARGESPGGAIMIHGMLNGWGWLGGLHRAWDWTNGCIAVTDAEIREIWSLVPNGTPIEIRGAT